MKITYLKNTRNSIVSSINKNGEKFYIVMDGTPVAVKLVDTHVTQLGDVVGKFLLATGTEVVGELNKCFKGKNIPYSDNGYIILFGIEKNPKEAYDWYYAFANLADLRIGKTIPFDYIDRFDVFGPWSKIQFEENYRGSFFSPYFYVANTTNGYVREVSDSCEYEFLVFDKTLNMWCLSKDGHTPHKNFRKDIFPTQSAAEKYYAAEISQKKVVDFDDEDTTEKTEFVSITIQIGKDEMKESVPTEFLGKLIKTINEMK